MGTTKGAKLHPQVDHVVEQPGQTEDHQQLLGSLGRQVERKLR